jgi:hypothetical protein
MPAMSITASSSRCRRSATSIPGRCGAGSRTQEERRHYADEDAPAGDRRARHATDGKPPNVYDRLTRGRLLGQRHLRNPPCPIDSPTPTFSGDQSASYLASPTDGRDRQPGDPPRAAAAGRRRGRLRQDAPGERHCRRTRARRPLIVMTVKSTSQAKDLLYRFDALRRLQDAQDPTNTDARRVYPYIELEPLGHAIRRAAPASC